MKSLWKSDAPLTAVGLFMLALLAANGLGLLLDPRSVAGAPAWLKPAKFAASTAIYSFTLAWIFGYLPAWIRTRRSVGRLTAAIFVGEIAIINIQAWRGVISHFNAATALDGALFVTMGLGILVQWIASMFVAVALWRERFADRALGWALRLGLTISIAGAGIGGLMTRPTAAQLAAAHETHRMPIAGAHTVGAPDGGPGLPGTAWSTAHGDLRIPHFLGLHALQALPLIALVTTRSRLTARQRERAVFAAAASYVGLGGILLWQALRGQSIVAPDAATLTALGVWAACSLVSIALALTLKSRSSGARSALAGASIAF